MENIKKKKKNYTRAKPSAIMLIDAARV